MKIMCRFTMSLFAISLLGGCASTSMLPRTASVVISEDDEGTIGLSCYKEKAVFKNVDKKQIIRAIRVGLKNEGFVPTLVDDAEGVVFGEHGMTLRNWNIIAGVYIEEKGSDALVVIVVRGSKKIGFADDVADGAWTGKILKSMRDYLEQANDSNYIPKKENGSAAF